MKVAIGADKKGNHLKEVIKTDLESQGFEILDTTPEGADDFVDSALNVTHAVLNNEAEKGIMIDEHGVGSFMASNKVKGMITANVTDENSARMTREHNDAKAISIGSGIVGEKLALVLANAFAHADYAAGRHQVRVDMMNKML
ncbi:galactose-6-phosphate isomerase subunit LacA [Pisciglobus halotolerans]|uniref:Galactose-6-phosphate isomerase lacA subunit n=1 Tax=Pisciglobus halotolerans TaxID=745365 RepID=A0A1I3CZW8_9LACT|nr:galactose-6-phosphate isomerase subunit LacA [Pisciglobus halotolerans]SFH80003.1 galactose-6-phosphate isomerase lacA subunit [Pisciglobus halotolerans]